MNKMRLLLVSLFFIFFFFPQLFNDHVFYCCDNLLINIPTKIFWSQQIKQGIIPTWNPYLFSGTPLLADINLSVLYPGNVFFLFIEPFHALTILLLVHLVIAFIGFLWIGKLLGLSKESKYIAAIVFIFSGTMIGYTGNLPMMQAAALLPWVFGSWIAYIQQPSKSSMGKIIIFSVLQIFAGHIQLTFYTMVFSFLYGLVFAKGLFKEKIRKLGLIGIGMFFVAGIQLIPFIHFALHTTRIGKGFAYASFGSLPLSAIFRLILPSLTGDQRIGTDWWQGGSVYGYIGILPLLLSFLILKKPIKHTIFFALIGGIAFFAAFGASLPIFPLLYSIIPGIGLFRVPSHFLLIYTVCFSLLAGFGYSIFVSLNDKEHYKYARLILWLGSMGMIVWLLLHVFLQKILTLLISFPVEKFQDKLQLINGRDGLLQILFSVQTNIGFIGFSFIILGLCIRYRTKLLGFCVIILIFADLYTYSRMNIVTAQFQTIKRWQTEQQEVIADIKRHTQPNYRFYVHPSTFFSPYAHVFGKSWMESEIQWQMQSFRPNLLMNYNIPIVDGYASMIDKRYQEQFGVAAQDPTGITIPDTAIDQLRKLHTKYIILPFTANRPNFPITGTVIWENKQIKILEVPAVTPISNIPISPATEENIFMIGTFFSIVGVLGFMILPKKYFY